MFARLSGMSAGARGLAGKARSTGGRAMTATADGLDFGGSYLTAFGKTHGGSSGRAVGMLGKGVLAASRHPKTTMGVAAGGIGYAGYRNRKGSQNNPLIGLE
jgi:hypothetical protein